MAGRRNQKAVVKSSIDASTMIYVSMALVILVLTLTIYTFGIDFGFLHIGGTPNVNILYGGAVVCVIISYIVDIMYIKAIRKYYRQKPTWLTYVPYFNFTSILSKNMSYMSYAIMAVIALVAIPAFTPLGRFMPVDYLMFMATNSIFIILGMMVVYTIIRGWSTYSFKSKISKKYREEISESYGSGGNLTLVSHVIYFLPIIRSISMFTDLNFINTVRTELQEMRRGEE